MEVENSDEKVRILMVDNDSTCLLINVALLKSKFEVVPVKSAKDALGVLKSSGLSFDLVVTEVHMLGMDGFQLQQEIAKEFNIPVVFLSADDEKSTVEKGVESGVHFFIVKPISQDDICHLWDYATSVKNKKAANQRNINEKLLEKAIYIESSSHDERNKSAKSFDEIEEEQSSPPPSKKRRIVWTGALQDKFCEAVTKLGLEKAHPRKILKLMDTPEVTRIHIASHLQKYRMSLQKETRSKNTREGGSGTKLDDFAMLDNICYIPHSTKVTTAYIQRQLNIQSSNVQKNYGGVTIKEGSSQVHSDHLNSELEQGAYGKFTAKECSLLQNMFLNQEHEKEKYDSITADESSFHLNNILSNSETQQEDYESFTAKDYSFLHNALNEEPEQENSTGIIVEERPYHFHNVLSNSKHEEENYGDANTMKESCQLHNDHPNSKLEKEIYGGITADERSSYLHNVLPNSEPQQGDYESFTAEECSLLHNIFSNQEHEQGNNGDITTQKGSFQLHCDHLYSKFEKEKYGGNTSTTDERSFHVDNVIPNSESQVHTRPSSRETPPQLKLKEFERYGF